MDQKHLSELTDEELLVEKKKLRHAKIFHALAIGFLAGILIFGIVAWSMSSDRHVGFIIPMLIPISIIYRLIKHPKQNKELEEILKARHLD